MHCTIIMNYALCYQMLHTHVLVARGRILRGILMTGIHKGGEYENDP